MTRTIALAVMAFQIAACSAAFDFDRRNDLPDTGEARGRVVRETSNAPASFSRVSTVGRGTFSRADVDGRFRVTGLPAGTHVLAFHEDTNGDGLFERAGQRGIRLTESRPAFQTTTVLGGLTLGDVSIRGLSTLIGEVRDAAGGIAGAKVIVRRAVVSTDETNFPTESTLGIETHVVTDSRGRFVMPNVVEGKISVMALVSDAATSIIVSEPTIVDAAPGSTMSNLVLSVARALAPSVDVDILMTPANVLVDDAVIVAVTAGMPPTNPAAQLASTTVGANRIDDRVRIVVPEGVAFDIYVDIVGNVPVNGALFRQIAFANNEGAANIVGPVILAPWDPCVAIEPSGDARDCDNDGRQGLPLVVDAAGNVTGDLAVWRACADACRDAYGTEAGLVSCRVGSQVFDCDDDGDDQPDVTEPPDCYGVSRGGDRDGDGVCDVVDPAPYCVGSFVLDEPCAFVPPPSWPLFANDDDGGVVVDDAGTDDAGADDAGADDAGADDAGNSDGGIEDAGGDFDAGIDDAGAGDGGTGFVFPVTDDLVGLASSYNHTCATDNAGELSCWGENQLGQVNPLLSRSLTVVTSPVLGPNPSGARVQQVVVGFEHTCALVDDESAPIWCWGHNSFGELGSLDAPSGEAPVPVLIPAAPPFQKISARFLHTCVLSPDGDAYCWGENTFGQVGAPASSTPSPPTLVPGGIAWRDVVAGKTSTCGITAATGAVYCWGNNDRGQLGIDVSTLSTEVPQPVFIGANPLEGQVAISVGSYHACAIDDDGATTCWGDRGAAATGSGQLVAGVDVPFVVTVEPMAEIAAGALHTCGRTTTNDVVCWGNNFYRQSVPANPSVIIESPTSTGVSGATRVVAGDSHTCVVTVTDEITCLGLNDRGQFGNGATSFVGANSPSTVSAPKTRIFTGIASDDGDDPMNWSPIGVPQNTETVKFLSPASATFSTPSIFANVIVDPTNTGNVSFLSLDVAGRYQHRGAGAVDVNDLRVGVPTRHGAVALIGPGDVGMLTLNGFSVVEVSGSASAQVADVAIRGVIDVVAPLTVSNEVDVGTGATLAMAFAGATAASIVVRGRVDVSDAVLNAGTCTVFLPGTLDVGNGNVVADTLVANVGGAVTATSGTVNANALDVFGSLFALNSTIGADDVSVGATASFSLPSTTLTVAGSFTVDESAAADFTGSHLVLAPPSLQTAVWNSGAFEYGRVTYDAAGATISTTDGLSPTIAELFAVRSTAVNRVAIQASPPINITLNGPRMVNHVDVDGVSIIGSLSAGAGDFTLAGTETGWGSVCGNYVVEGDELCDSPICGGAACTLNPSGQVKTWVGSVSSQASEPQNWNPSGVPFTSSIVVFDDTAIADCTFDLLLSADSVHLTPTFSRLVDVQTDLNVATSIVVEGGTLRVGSGSITAGYGLVMHDGGRVESEPSTTITLRGSSLLTAQAAIQGDLVVAPSGDGATFRIHESGVARLVLATGDTFLSTAFLDVIYSDPLSRALDLLMLDPERTANVTNYRGLHPSSRVEVYEVYTNHVQGAQGSLTLDNGTLWTRGGISLRRTRVLMDVHVNTGGGHALVLNTAEAGELVGSLLVESGELGLVGMVGVPLRSPRIEIKNGGWLYAASDAATNGLVADDIHIGNRSGLALNWGFANATNFTQDVGSYFFGENGSLSADRVELHGGEVQLPPTLVVNEILTLGPSPGLYLDHNCGTISAVGGDAQLLTVTPRNHTLHRFDVSDFAGDVEFVTVDGDGPMVVERGFNVVGDSDGRRLSGVGDGMFFLSVTGASVIDGFDNVAEFAHVGPGYLAPATSTFAHVNTSGIVAPSSCGDGLLTADEGCDPAAPFGAEACTDTCLIRSGYWCALAGETVEQECVDIRVCGDGSVDSNEGCDDGNTVDGDGCSGACTLETGAICRGCPSRCKFE